MSEANSDSSCTLIPIAALDRSQLRLSDLDFSPLRSSLPSGGLFRASTSIFNDYPQGQGVNLLLARLAPNVGLYIIEKAGESVYVACRLRSWLKEDHFRAAVTGKAGNSFPKKVRGFENRFLAGDAHPASENDLAGACKTAISSPKRPKNRKGVLARMSIIPKLGFRESSTLQQEHAPPVERDAPATGCHTREDLPVDALRTTCHVQNGSKHDIREAQHQPADTGTTGMSGLGPDLLRSHNDPFATHREILLQTIYAPKSALAYFTKSTLVRFRATLRSSTTMGNSDLAAFYRSRLLTPKKLDMKYRDTIPKIVENTILQVSPDEREAHPQKKTSRRKGLGKDGLHAGEEALIRAWWLNRDGVKNLASAQSRVQKMQSLLTELRCHETQLHIILILEILTLESRDKLGSEAMLRAASPKQEPADDEHNNILVMSPLKINKKRDLKRDLDILVDRLCIYQSVSVIDPTTTDEGKTQISAFGEEVGDELRDFCCNIILPFYRHKVPGLVKEISRKLDGPDLSPKRPMTSSRTISSSRAKPGTAVDACRRTIPRRTLKRVLSEEQSSRQSSPPMLMRSATAPLGGSGSQALAATVQRAINRSSLQKSRSFSNREVDLVASSKAQDAKRERLASLAKQKEELNAAIGALKKPNRGLIGMEIMGEIERRNAERDTSKSSTLGKSSSDHHLGIQITATPRKRAAWGNLKRKASRSSCNVSTESEDLARAMSEEPIIPTSTARGPDCGSRRSASQGTDAPTTKRAIHSAVQETPSRGLSKASNPASLPTNIQAPQQPGSPARQCPRPNNVSVVQATPSTKRLRPDHADLAKIDTTPLRMTKSQRPVLFEPLKRMEVTIEDVFRDAPVVSENAGKAMERAMNGGRGEEASIYDLLGWDGDVDELL